MQINQHFPEVMKLTIAARKEDEKENLMEKDNVLKNLNYTEKSHFIISYPLFPRSKTRESIEDNLIYRKTHFGFEE